jgi:hypothetical protein
LLAAVAEAVADTDATTEAALREAAALVARESAGRALRSDDVPWLTAFSLFMKLVLGRDHDEWEEMRNDRHRTELTSSLAVALGFPAELGERRSTVRLASAVDSFDPGPRNWSDVDFVEPGEHLEAGHVLVEQLTRSLRVLEGERDLVVRAAARLLLQSADIPISRVELGLLGLRYRREQTKRA